MQSPSIIFFGRTGSGKSYLAEKLTNSNVFRANQRLTTGTRKIDEASSYVKELRQNVTFIDPTGFEIGKTGSISDLVDEAFYLSKIFTRSFNIILYCVSAMGTRFDKQYIDDLLILQGLYGPEILSHLCIVITQWDMINPSMESQRREIWGRDEIQNILSTNGVSLKTGLMAVHADNDNLYKSVLRPLESYLRQQPYTCRDLPLMVPQKQLLGVLSSPIVQRYLEHVRKTYEEENESQKVNSNKKKGGSNSLEARITIIQVIASYLSGDLSDMLRIIKENSSLPFFQALINYFECDKTNSQRSLFDDIKIVFKPYIKKFSESEPNNDFSIEIDQPMSTQLIDQIIISLTELMKVDLNHYGQSQEELRHQTTSHVNPYTLSSTLQTSLKKIEVNHNHGKSQTNAKESFNFKKQIFFSCLGMALGSLFIFIKPLKHIFASLKSLDNVLGWILFGSGLPAIIGSTLWFLKKCDEKKRTRENEMVNKLHNCLYGSNVCKEVVMAIMIVFFDLNRV